MFDQEKIPTQLNGRTVYHVFKAVDDAALLTFLDQREKLDEDAALVLFYDLFATGLEGLKGPLPLNWKDLLPATEKRDVAKRTFLHCYFLPAEEVTELLDDDGLSFADYVAIDRGERSYQYQTYHNGTKQTISVTLRLFTAEERKNLLRVLGKETYSERYKIEYSAQVARDAHVRTSAAAVPIIQWAAIALHHLTSDSLVLEKN